jgi:hypothetical protein
VPAFFGTIPAKFSAIPTKRQCQPFLALFKSGKKPQPRETGRSTALITFGRSIGAASTRSSGGTPRGKDMVGLGRVVLAKLFAPGTPVEADPALTALRSAAFRKSRKATRDGSASAAQ